MSKPITPQEIIEKTSCIEHPERETLIDYLDLIKPNEVWVMDLNTNIYLMKAVITDNKGVLIALEVKKPYTCKTTVIQFKHASLIY